MHVLLLRNPKCTFSRKSQGANKSKVLLLFAQPVYDTLWHLVKSNINTYFKAIWHSRLLFQSTNWLKISLLFNLVTAYVRSFIESKVSLLKKIVLLLFAQPQYMTHLTLKPCKKLFRYRHTSCYKKIVQPYLCFQFANGLQIGLFINLTISSNYSYLVLTK
jgi:hypothetical protein